LIGAKIHNSYDKLRSSFWFIPSLMALLVCILAANLLIFEIYNERYRFLDSYWMTLMEADGARDILTTVSGSMITVIAIVYSITIVCLSLASQQFGPRLLQNFMRDRGNQYVLGTVTATYLYCTLILPIVSEGFVPYISILFGLALAVLCVGVLIYFIHHVSESIQVSNIIDRVSRDLSSAIDRLYPKKVQMDSNPQELDSSLNEEILSNFDQRAKAVQIDREGYLQSIDQNGLLDFASKKNLVIRILYRHGHFVMKGADLVQIWPKEAAEKEDLTETINSYFITGSKRTQTEDLEFLINELVEIAGRALSPGVNDPFTAITCIDQLGARLSELVQRRFPPVLRRDSKEQVRLIIYPVRFVDLVDAAFNQIRQYGREDAAITVRLLETIEKIMPFTRNEEHREDLLRQARMIERGSLEGLSEKEDRREVQERKLAILAIIKERFGQDPAW